MTRFLLILLAGALLIVGIVAAFQHSASSEKRMIDPHPVHK